MGPNPTDRGKPGTKQSLLVEGGGGPLGVVIAGANVNDPKLLEGTIEAIVVERPDPEPVEQHLCLDKGYDNPTGHEVVEKFGYVNHIRPIGADRRGKSPAGPPQSPPLGGRATLAWLSKCRALLVRYDKHDKNIWAIFS